MTTAADNAQRTDQPNTCPDPAANAAAPAPADQASADPAPVAPAPATPSPAAPAPAVPSAQRFALLVSGSPCGAAPELLWELAEGMSFIVAVDSGADWLCAANLIPDLIVGDLDSCSAESLRILREQEVEELVYPTAKDATDLELALAEVAQRDYGNLVATNILGGRSDHALAALGNLVQAVQRGLAVTVVEPTETIIILSAASPHDHLTLDFADGLEAGQAPTISLIPWGGPAEVSASGFQWQLDHATLSPLQSLGVSNLPVAAQPRIDLHQGDLLVIVQVPAF